MKKSLHTRSALIASTAAAALILAACGSSGTDSGSGELDPDADLSTQSIVVDNWGGYMADDIADQFKAATGASMTVSEHATNEEIMAKLTAGGDAGIDVAFVSGQYAQALNEAGLLEPINAELIPNLKNLYPEASQLAYDPGNTFSVPYTWGNTGICYRSDLVDPAPTSWYDILTPDPAYAGKITSLATERWLALPAQKALGFSVNTSSDDELAQIKDLLIQEKKTLLGYDDTIFYEKLISGDAVMAEAWDGWCGYGIAEDPNIKFVVPSEGTDLWVDTMVVLKNSKNKEAAFAFINLMLDGEMHAWITNNVTYNAPNKAAQEFISDEFKAQFSDVLQDSEELFKGESIIDIGADSVKYTTLTTDVTSS